MTYHDHVIAWVPDENATGEHKMVPVTCTEYVSVLLRSLQGESLSSADIRMVATVAKSLKDKKKAAKIEEETAVLRRLAAAEQAAFPPVLVTGSEDRVIICGSTCGHDHESINGPTGCCSQHGPYMYFCNECSELAKQPIHVVQDGPRDEKGRASLAHVQGDCCDGNGSCEAARS